ncbi:MAG TPA: HAMP domain-containing protein [Opitutaceae bacterium]|nr:HAMP domain-containing protein [Opitutaceae bacterium]
MSRRGITLTLQGWLLALLLPTLGLLIVGYAVFVYERLQDYVVDGFGAKLSAASTATAAFIDPADHKQLVEPLPIEDMTHDSIKSVLWALDSVRHEILRIRPRDGLAMPSGIKVPEEMDSLSNDLDPNELLAGDDETGRFLRVNLTTGALTPGFNIPPPVHAVAAEIRRGVLYVAGRDLQRVDLRTGQVTHVGPLPEVVRDLTHDRKRDVLWALNQEGDGLLELNPDTGQLLKRVPLSFETPADGADAGQIPHVHLRALAFERVSETLFGSSVSLMRIDPEKGTVSAQGYLASFGQEEGPIYKRYVAPMQRILRRAGLTYLYTQEIQGRDHIIYGLDGTVGKDHSPLLSTDTVREAEVAGVQRVMTEGIIYVSGMDPWPPWGLIKSSFVPMFDEHGVPVAMAGADVNATVIQFKIRRALVFTFGLGALMLALAGALAYVFARRLTTPLLAIKSAALHAAAGDFQQKASVTRPLELRLLAERFATAAAALGEAIETFRRRLEARRGERDRHGLIESLGRHPALTAPAPGAPWAWGSLDPAAESGAASGAVQVRDRALAWIVRAGEDPLAAAARRAETAMAAEALLARLGADPAALGRALEDLFPREIAAWILLAPDGLRAHLRAEGLLRRIGADGSSTAAGATFEEPIQPGPGELLVAAGPGAPLERLPVPDGAGPAALIERWRRAAPAPAFAVVLAAP